MRFVWFPTGCQSQMQMKIWPKWNVKMQSLECVLCSSHCVSTFNHEDTSGYFEKVFLCLPLWDHRVLETKRGLFWTMIGLFHYGICFMFWTQKPNLRHIWYIKHIPMWSTPNIPKKTCLFSYTMKNAQTAMKRHIKPRHHNDPNCTLFLSM